MGYLNPLLNLQAGRALLELPRADRERIEAVMRELRDQANTEADKAWRRRKGPMAAYWRAVATYARHIAHACRKEHNDGLERSIEMLKTQEPKYDAVDGRIVNRASGEPIPDDEPIFVFRARDVKALHALRAYFGHCTDTHHMAAVTQRIEDFKAFAQTHPERMKEPDTASSNDGA